MGNAQKSGMITPDLKNVRICIQSIFVRAHACASDKWQRVGVCKLMCICLAHVHLHVQAGVGMGLDQVPVGSGKHNLIVKMLSMKTL